jgi:hypothetical protein
MDWSKQDVELATEMGLSRERIRQLRRKFGAPTSAHHRTLRTTAKALQWARDNLDGLKGLTGAEVWRKYGLSPNWRCSQLYQFLRPYLRGGDLLRKHRWDSMNLRLPNRDLERIWRLGKNTVGYYRVRNRRPQPSWTYKHGHPQFSGRRKVLAYHRALKTEKRNAAKYFARVASQR